MTPNELKPLADPVRAVPATVGHTSVQGLLGGTSDQNRIGHNTKQPRPWSRSAAAVRTGSYIGRFGPDCLCFLEFPALVRARMRFESHLGHSVSAGQRPFALTC
jgi:hypothetical protein